MGQSSDNFRKMDIPVNKIPSREAIFMIVDDSQVNLRLTKRKLLIAFGEAIVESNIKFSLDGLEAIAQFKQIIESGSIVYVIKILTFRNYLFAFHVYTYEYTYISILM